jgi:hypothetical protein
MGGVNPRRGVGRSHRPLLERDILAAQKATRSAKEAARYLNVAYTTYRKYAEMYGIFEQHKRQGGRWNGAVSLKGAFGLESIFRGEHPNYDRGKLKERVFKSGLIPQECRYCGFNEKRISDGKIPLLLDYRDGNRNNLVLENLCAICYNCAYLTTGRVTKNMVSQATHDSDLLDTFNASEADLEVIRNEILAEMQENPEK